MLLHLLDLLPLDAEARLETLPPETAPPVRMVDFLVLLAGAFARCLFHIEFQLDWWAEIPERMAQYGINLVSQYGIKTVSVVLLLRPDRAPKDAPPSGRYLGRFQVDETYAVHPFRVARVWEIDPAPLLATKDPRLFPWAVLMKCDDQAVREIGRVLAESGDEESVARFLTLGSLRYDRRELERWLGGSRMRFEEAIIEGSWIFQDRLKQHGIESRVDEAKRMLRRFLAAKFAGLETLPEIDSISDLDALESILDRVFASSDRASVEKVIIDAPRA